MNRRAPRAGRKDFLVCVPPLLSAHRGLSVKVELFTEIPPVDSATTGLMSRTDSRYREAARPRRWPSGLTRRYQPPCHARTHGSRAGTSAVVGKNRCGLRFRWQVASLLVNQEDSSSSPWLDPESAQAIALANALDHPRASAALATSCGWDRGSREKLQDRAIVHAARLTGSGGYLHLPRFQHGGIVLMANGTSHWPGLLIGSTSRKHHVWVRWGRA
jgi:hypothetical protein